MGYKQKDLDREFESLLDAYISYIDSGKSEEKTKEYNAKIDVFQFTLVNYLEGEGKSEDKDEREGLELLKDKVALEAMLKSCHELDNFLEGMLGTSKISKLFPD